MGIDENQIKMKTPAQLADHLMKMSPKVEDVICVAVTKDGRMLMMSTPMSFNRKAMVTAIINHEMNRTTAEAIAVDNKQGSDH